MGRKYYCDYCDKSFSCTPDAIKKHVNGLQHQKLRNEHYAAYDDAETILEREGKKNPCKRFIDSGQCMFGANCKYTHYTKYQLDALRQEVFRVKSSDHIVQPQPPPGPDFTFDDWLMSRKLRNLPNSQHLEDIFAESWVRQSTRGTIKIAPWMYPQILHYSNDLPVSLKPLAAANFEMTDLREWG